jgi:hypothetical protein
VTEQRSGPRIGRRPVLVALFVPAAIVGLIIGTLLGTSSNPTPPSRTSSLVATVASPGGTAPSANATATISTSAGPDTSAKPVLELKGTGSKRSAQFDVLVGWQIQWETEADHIVVEATGEKPLGKVVDEEGPASGVTSPPQGGTFRLQVTADGPWSITVIQGTG